MQNKKERSSFVAILQTAGFFVVIIGVISLILYLSGFGNNPEIKKTEEYEYLNISTLAGFYYETPTADIVSNPDVKRNIQIPEKIMQFNGKKVSITGFMMPVKVDSEGNVDEFAINGNYDMCFYGAPSSLNQWVHVKMNQGKTAKFSHNATTISGVLEVGELVENGEVVSIYRLTGEKATSYSRSFY